MNKGGDWPARVAIVHYWLVGMRGGERVVEELLRMFPEAEIFTHVADREKLSDLIKSRPIHETSVAGLPGARKHYQKYLGFMPRALEEIDLHGFDLVISSESGPAKGVIVPPGVPHICYVHSPMRYIWDHYPFYRERLGKLGRAYFSRLAHRLRMWDVASAQRVDRFVANSSFVASRVKRFYRRDADVVHPPVDLDTFGLPEEDIRRDHYLFVSELVPYKRADLVIEAFRELDAKLVIVGDGSEYSRLSRNLPSNVSLLGRVSTDDLLGHYRTARALIFPGEEDFGIVPVEAMACGTPVLAYGRGGVLDSVSPGTDGLFFYEQSADALRECIRRFQNQSHVYVPEVIAQRAKRFAPSAFRNALAKIVREEMAAQAGNRPSKDFRTVPDTGTYRQSAV